MPVKKDMWILANEAAEILTKNSGHEIHPDYVRLLARQGKVLSRVKDGRTREYRKEDFVGRIVKQKRTYRRTIEENAA